MNLRNSLKFVALLSLVFYAHTSTAQTKLACGGDFKGKTIKMIVPFSVGGGYDTYTRVFAPHFAQTTGARVLVENWPAGKGVIGSRKIAQASPDGLTIGIVNASKRITSTMLGDENVPDMNNDFILLGRIARSRHVLLVGTDSEIQNVNTLFDMHPAPVLGTNNLRSAGYIATALEAELLQMDFDTVSGVGGKSKRVLAASRGDVDIISSNFYSVLSDIESGTIRPIMQISSTPIDAHPALKSIPLLGGPNGIAAQRAAELKLDVAETIQMAQAIETILSAGRLFAATANLPDGLARCLQDAVFTTLQSEGLVASARQANLALDVADGSSARSELEASRTQFEQLIPVLRKIVEAK